MVPFRTATVTFAGSTAPLLLLVAARRSPGRLRRRTSLLAAAGRRGAAAARVVARELAHAKGGRAAEDQDARDDEHEVARAGEQAPVPGRLGGGMIAVCCCGMGRGGSMVRAGARCAGRALSRRGGRRSAGGRPPAGVDGAPAGRSRRRWLLAALRGPRRVGGLGLAPASSAWPMARRSAGRGPLIGAARPRERELPRRRRPRSGLIACRTRSRADARLRLPGPGRLSRLPAAVAGCGWPGFRGLVAASRRRPPPRVALPGASPSSPSAAGRRRAPASAGGRWRLPLACARGRAGFAGPARRRAAAARLRGRAPARWLAPVLRRRGWTGLPRLAARSAAAGWLGCGCARPGTTWAPAPADRSGAGPPIRAGASRLAPARSRALRGRQPGNRGQAGNRPDFLDDLGQGSTVEPGSAPDKKKFKKKKR